MREPSTLTRGLGWIALCSLASACFVPDADYSLKACAPGHPCAAGYSCSQGLCLAGSEGAPDGGAGAADAGFVEADADAGAVLCQDRCVGNVHHRCYAGVAEVELDCTLTGQTCDPGLGCVGP